MPGLSPSSSLMADGRPMDSKPLEDTDGVYEQSSFRGSEPMT